MIRLPKKKNSFLKESASHSVSKSSSQNLVTKLQSEVYGNKSYLNLVLGVLIVLVAGLLVFNYFKKGQPDLGSSEQITSEDVQEDVKPQDLPGKYTVKEGDTLFTIAEKYYNDGYQFSKISEANKLANENIIEVGQVLEIPKVEEPKTVVAEVETATGGAVNQTIWGEKIEGKTYTVVEGDWLSTIAGRAYGDIMAYTKIAEANNIADPDVINPGTVLTLPR